MSSPEGLVNPAPRPIPMTPGRSQTGLKNPASGSIPTTSGEEAPGKTTKKPPITENGLPDSQAVQCQGPGHVPKLPPRPRRARSGVHKSRPAEIKSAQGWNRPSGPTQERVDEFRRYLVQQGPRGSYDPAKVTDAELLEAFLSD